MAGLRRSSTRAPSWRLDSRMPVILAEYETEEVYCVRLYNAAKSSAVAYPQRAKEIREFPPGVLYSQHNVPLKRS
jgi:hypothetical protein